MLNSGNEELNQGYKIKVNENKEFIEDLKNDVIDNPLKFKNGKNKEKEEIEY